MMSFCSRYWLTKSDLVAEAQLLDELDQAVAVLLAALLEQFRVGLAGDQVERLGMRATTRA